MRRSRPRRLAEVLLAGLAVLAVAACGGDEVPTAPEPSPTGAAPAPPPAQMSPVPSDANYNAADVVFAQETLRHLDQAVQMARLARTRAHSGEVRRLAVKAEQDRDDVVILLDSWLREHGQPIPSVSPTAGQAGGRNGLATAAELNTLAGLRGQPFDRLFLQMLIVNNRSASVLINGQQWAGKAAPLMSIAHKLNTDHTAELEAARRLLGR